MATATGLALCNVLILFVLYVQPGFTSDLAENQEFGQRAWINTPVRFEKREFKLGKRPFGGGSWKTGAKGYEVEREPSDDVYNVRKRSFGDRSYKGGSMASMESGDLGFDGQPDSQWYGPEQHYRKRRSLSEDEEDRDKRPFGTGPYYGRHFKLDENAEPEVRKTALEDDMHALDEKRAHFHFGKRGHEDESGDGASSYEREVEKRPFGNGVHHWQPKTRSQEEKEEKEQEERERSKIVPEKRPFGPLMRDTVRGPGLKTTDPQHDNIDKRKLFSFGKRQKFSFGKRQKFAFGKRQKFAFGKRKLFSFGKRQPE